MGHKVHPIGFRLGILRDWQAKWYADKNYTEFLQEDLALRKEIILRYAEAAISKVEIDRQANQVTVAIHTARPGIVIGRGGQRVDEMRKRLEKLTGKKVRLNIEEIRQPELDASLVARSVAEQISRRVSYRRAIRQAAARTLQAGAKGIKIVCAGRLGGAEIARREVIRQGQVPLHTLRADIDYGFAEAHTTLGRVGVKVWIYRGEVLPKSRRQPAEAMAPAEAAPAGRVGALETAAPSTVEASRADVPGQAEVALASAAEEVDKDATTETGEVSQGS